MENDRSYRIASILAVFTIIYNIVEGLVSVFFGYSDETLALFGFGIDSFVEVVSGIGILHMVRRIRRNPGSDIDTFEVTALRLTGWGFYVLAAGLVAGIVLNLVTGRKPESTLWGTIISSASIVIMLWLYLAKRRTGKHLGSDPILADANCTLVCFYMSLVLLISSLLYEFTGFQWADALGAAGLVWFSFSEGREALEKARRRRYEECSCH